MNTAKANVAYRRCQECSMRFTQHVDDTSRVCHPCQSGLFRNVQFSMRVGMVFRGPRKRFEIFRWDFSR